VLNFSKLHGLPALDKDIKPVALQKLHLPGSRPLAGGFFFSIVSSPAGR
jgi:hypothetical protein